MPTPLRTHLARLNAQRGASRAVWPTLPLRTDRWLLKGLSPACLLFSKLIRAV